MEFSPLGIRLQHFGPLVSHSETATQSDVCQHSETRHFPRKIKEHSLLMSLTETPVPPCLEARLCVSPALTASPAARRGRARGTPGRGRQRLPPKASTPSPPHSRACARPGWLSGIVKNNPAKRVRKLRMTCRTVRRFRCATSASTRPPRGNPVAGALRARGRVAHHRDLPAPGSRGSACARCRGRADGRAPGWRPAYGGVSAACAASTCGTSKLLTPANRICLRSARRSMARMVSPSG